MQISILQNSINTKGQSFYTDFQLESNHILISYIIPLWTVYFLRTTFTWRMFAWKQGISLKSNLPFLSSILISIFMKCYENLSLDSISKMYYTQQLSSPPRCSRKHFNFTMDKDVNIKVTPSEASLIGINKRSCYLETYLCEVFILNSYSQKCLESKVSSLIKWELTISIK